MTRPLPGYPGYAVTDAGEVLGKAGQPLRPRAHWRTGHLRVRVYGGTAARRAVVRGERVHACRYDDLYVHVAVCLAWHGPPPFEGALVRHLDDDPHNNDPANLRWGTRLENAADRRRNSVDDDGFDWATGEAA